MNIRQISFLNMLVSHSGEFLPIDRFAEDLQVSQKTLRRDLDLIETYLKDFGAGIERRSGVGSSRTQGISCATGSLISPTSAAVRNVNPGKRSPGAWILR